MDPNILASQKRQDMLATFWPRKISPYITRVLVKTPITPNQTTIVWGVISVLNSLVVYAALTGWWVAIPLVPVIFQLAFILDCVDGEIARYKNMANPIGGKLLDGICHRATEFALLAAFALAAYTRTGSWLSLPVALLLLTGDGMYVYVYERRLSTLRSAGFTGQIRKTPAGVYQRGTRWSELTRKQQVSSILELFHYKSTYAVIALSFLRPELFLGGLAAIGAYKHWKWLMLMRRSLSHVSRLQASETGDGPVALVESGSLTQSGRVAGNG